MQILISNAIKHPQSQIRKRSISRTAAKKLPSPCAPTQTFMSLVRLFVAVALLAVHAEAAQIWSSSYSSSDCSGTPSGPTLGTSYTAPGSPCVQISGGSTIDQYCDFSTDPPTARGTFYVSADCTGTPSPYVFQADDSCNYQGAAASGRYTCEAGAKLTYSQYSSSDCSGTPSTSWGPSDMFSTTGAPCSGVDKDNYCDLSTDPPTYRGTYYPSADCTGTPQQYAHQADDSCVYHSPSFSGRYLCEEDDSGGGSGGQLSPPAPPPLSPPADAAPSPPPPDTDSGCSNTCEGGNPDWADDGQCDDGGPGSANNGAENCAYGTDCSDCGRRDWTDQVLDIIPPYVFVIIGVSILSSIAGGVYKMHQRRGETSSELPPPLAGGGSGPGFGQSMGAAAPPVAISSTVVNPAGVQLATNVPPPQAQGSLAANPPVAKFDVNTGKPISTQGGSVADEISRLAKMRDDGLLSEEEFKAAKTKVLAGESQPQVASGLPLAMAQPVAVPVGFWQA
jgi:hypothetical protein